MILPMLQYDTLAGMNSLDFFFYLDSFMRQCDRLCRRRHSPYFVQLSSHDFFPMHFFVTIFFFFSKIDPLFYFSGSFHVSGYGLYPKICLEFALLH